MAQLSAFEDVIPAADLGLALALAGQPERGAQYLVNAVRQGHNSPKARQNLAYAYALAGNWPAARVMAAEDVPADQLDARLTDWASTSRPEDFQIRVATLLGVTPAYDSGLPQSLALSNFPSMDTMVAEAQTQADGPATVAEEPVAVAVAESAPAVAPAPAPNPGSDVPMPFGIAGIDKVEFESNPVVQNVSEPAPTAAPVRVAEAAPASTRRSGPVRVSGSRPRTSTPAPAPSPSVAPAPVRMPAVAAAPSRGAPRFVSNAVVHAVPEAAEPAPRQAPATQQRRIAVASGSAATHLVQLGAFNSREVAESKWAQFQRRYPDLKGRDVVITEALVNGRTYFRVAAAGFGSRTARSMCSTLRAGGTGCFAYAASSPPAGAVDRGVRVAAR